MRMAEWLMIGVAAVLAAAVIITALPDPNIRYLTYGTVAAKGTDGTRCHFDVDDGAGHWDWWEVTPEAFEAYRIGDSVSRRVVCAP
ncbi:MAG: hypothetical protein IKN00_04055 [Bacteroidales bacterium]|nr:hypothetical protein [Bacteroidales bacterium]